MPWFKTTPHRAWAAAATWAGAGLLAAGSALAQAPAASPAGAAPTAPKRYDVRDFFSNPPQAYFRLSEDGKRLAFMAPVPMPLDDKSGKGGTVNRRNIHVQDLNGSTPVGTPRVLTQESARDVNNYFWKGNRTLIYQKDFGGDENYHVVAVDAVTGKVTDLTPWEGVRAEVIDDLPDDPQHMLISHNKRDKKVFDIYRVNVATGASTLVGENPGDVTSWITDHRGQLRLGVASRGTDTFVVYRPGNAGKFKDIIKTDFKTEVQPLFFTADNKRFYALSNRGRDKKALVTIDPAKPDAEQLIFERNDVDLWSAVWSRKAKRMTHAEFMTAKMERKFFDEAVAKRFAALATKLPGMEINLQSATRDESKFIVAASSDVTEGARYIYDAKGDTLTRLAVINPKIDPKDMAPMRPISYTSRDGLTINGYLTLPVGKDAKNLACIVNPHGGPWARDGWGFNPEVQFLANRGFCVLQMNFRGSTGYGRKFWEASFKQWGRTMQNDVTDGVQWLISQGIADPKRVGIYGGSYGGYTTLAGVTFTPDLYAAAVNYVGVSNLLTFMNTIPPYWEPWRKQMYEMVGNPETEKAALMAASPVFHADKIRTPLFVAQGARDPRVNKAESDQIVEALRKRGVDVEYMVKDNEGHGFQNEENKFEFYGAMERFFLKHLKP